MYTRSKLLQKLCPSYFDKVAYFTGRAFCLFEELPSQISGNFAAVCFLYSHMSIDDMLTLARHFNYSETSFLSPIEKDLLQPKSDIFKTEKRFRLRWLTPTVEVKLCGHATVVTARSLVQYGNKNRRFEFETLSGVLVASVDQDGNVSLDFPVNFPRQLFTEEKKIGMRYDPDYMATIENSQYELFDDLATKVLPYHKFRDRELWYSPDSLKLVVYLPNADEDDMRKLAPDFPILLSAHNGSMVKGIIVTCLNKNSDCDFLSRYFAPWNGINEDPVTGSAHTVLGPMYTIKLKKTELHGKQVSISGGELKMKLSDVNSFNCKRITLSGKAIPDQQGYL